MINKIEFRKDLKLFQTRQKVSNLLSYGLNTIEISAMLSLHRVTIQRHKSALKKEFWKIYEKPTE